MCPYSKDKIQNMQSEPECNDVKFNICNASKKYNQVSAGEVCTIEQAKILGIYQDQNYFKENDQVSFTKELQTQNPLIDNSDTGRDRTYPMCTESSTTGAAYPFCTLSSGMGFIRKPGTQDTCIPYECPTGFTVQGGICKKPKVKASEPKKKSCSNRWYDWMTVPNHHLGNGYYADEESKDCMKPCPASFTPFYATDPIDGESINFTAKDKLTKCVAKSDFFDGKYGDTGDYCPIVWIHRLGMTKEDWKQKLNEEYKRGTEGTANKYMQTLRTPENISSVASTLFAQCQNPKALENAIYTDEKHENACQSLHQQGRLQTAYAICQRVRDMPEDVKDGMRVDGASDSKADLKMKILQQACNSLFCNKQETLDIIGKSDTICFDEVNKEIDMDGLKENTAQEMNPQSFKNNNKGVDRLKWIVKLTVLLIIGGIACSVVLAILFYLYKQIEKRFIDK